MRNIKCTVAYNGTNFCGWQIQDGQRTVQGVLADALEKMHRKPLKLTAAGRTDTGVHARGQVVNFYSDLKSIPDWKFRDAINFYLPTDISIIDSCQVDDDFSARFSARKRVYKYYFYVSPVHLPHFNDFAARRTRFPDIRNLNRMAACLIGEKDFSTFAAAGDQSSSKKRVVSAAGFFPEGEFLIFKIAADSFLYRMVRSLVGTLTEFDDNGRGPEQFREILEAKDRKLAGTTAPARGLFLEKVYYGNEPDYFG